MQDTCSPCSKTVWKLKFNIFLEKEDHGKRNVVVPVDGAGEKKLYREKFAKMGVQTLAERIKSIKSWSR